MNIGENILKARKKAGLKQSELADLIDGYQKEISNWERGVRTPTAEYIIRLCKALQISADELLGTGLNHISKEDSLKN